MKSTFVQKLIDSAKKHAQKTAIVDDDGRRETSYAELYALAQKVSAYIGLKDIPEQSFICVRMHNSMEFMAAELGIWMSRCVAVPIGMNSPEERVRTIQAHCDSQLMIDESVMHEIYQLPQPEGYDCSSLPDSTDHALLMYTSGSTGTPKGILHTFEPFDVGYPHISGLATPSEDQVFGNSVPFYFMPIMFMWDMLCAGATVHIYSDRTKTDPDALQQYIIKHGITTSHISPAVLLRFHNKSPLLKAVITAGERLTTQCSKDGYKLYNLYGQSELSASVTCFELPDHPMTMVPLGTCIEGIECCVTGDNGEVVPDGVDGELRFRGKFCKEYFKDPERTAKLYTDGWIHTGDIAMMGTDGLIYYKERRDWMVKVNGQRVEPGEVESAIVKMDEVKNAIVKGFDNGRNSQYLCAFYLADRDIDQQEFKRFLDTLIPPYMQPTVYVRMEAFPLNANGKINRLVLEAPKRDMVKTDIVPPKTDREYALLEIAQEVLETKDFGVTDNLYELGMDSICAAQFAAKAAEKDYIIKAVDIAKYPTIRQLAECSMSLIYWFEPYNEDKPILVFACGAIGIGRLERRMKSLAQHYNVLVVEAYYEHYTYIVSNEERYEDVVGLYYDLFDLMVTDKTKVAGFIGFSFGGTVAYSLCQMLHQQTGRVCKVIMGDSPLVFDHYTAISKEAIEKEIQEIAAINPDEKLTAIRIFHYGMHSILNMMSEWSASPINADVLFFRAQDCTQQNLQKLHDCVKDVTIIDIDDDHFSFVVDKTHKWHEVTVAKTLEFLS